MKGVNEVKTITKEEAEELVVIAKGIVNRESYIIHLEKVYKMIVEGKKILDLYEVFMNTGTNENGLPKLAIARADRKWIYLTSKGNFQYRTQVQSRWGTRWNSYLDFSLPKDTFPLLKNMHGTTIRYKARIPIIPVKHFPKDELKKYFILWEVESWEEAELMPSDPFLLKRLTKNLFVIIAEWDLTPLEKSIMKGL